VSENGNATSLAQQHIHGKQLLKRCVLRRLRTTGSDCADVTCCGRLFQTEQNDDYTSGGLNYCNVDTNFSVK